MVEINNRKEKGMKTLLTLLAISMFCTTVGATDILPIPTQKGRQLLICLIPQISVQLPFANYNACAYARTRVIRGLVEADGDDHNIDRYGKLLFCVPESQPIGIQFASPDPMQ
jgi:hypothetical protein